MGHINITTGLGGGAAKIIAVIDIHGGGVLGIFFAGICAANGGAVLSNVKQSTAGGCHLTGLCGIITTVKVHLGIGIGIENTAGGRVAACDSAPIFLARTVADVQGRAGIYTLENTVFGCCDVVTV